MLEGNADVCGSRILTRLNPNATVAFSNSRSKLCGTNISSKFIDSLSANPSPALTTRTFPILTFYFGTLRRFFSFLPQKSNRECISSPNPRELIQILLTLQSMLSQIFTQNRLKSAFKTKISTEAQTTLQE